MKRQVIISLIFWAVLALVAVLMWLLPVFDEDSLGLKIMLSVVMVCGFIKDIVVLLGVEREVAQPAGCRWKDRKRTFLGLPLSFTKYKLTNEKLMVDTGVLNTSESEIRLYRIVDLDLTRSFGQRILGLGTITVHSSDKSDSTLVIKNVKSPARVKELISNCVEEERMKKRVSSREIIDDHDMDDDCCCHDNVEV